MSYLDNFNVERIDSIPEVRQQLRNLRKAIDNKEIGTYTPPSTGIPKTDLSQEVRNSLLKADNAVPKAISTTWSELKSLRDNSQLIPGCWYRITDYECTTVQAHTKSAGHQFDILVLAISVNTLSEEARAIQHEGDTYFANSNLNVWKLKYKLDNICWSQRRTNAIFTDDGHWFDYIGTVNIDGTTYKKWYNSDFSYEYGENENFCLITLSTDYDESTNIYDLVNNEIVESDYGVIEEYKYYQEDGKGIIVWMKDESNNECTYDFKNIQFKRWKVDDEHTYFTDKYVGFANMSDPLQLSVPDEDDFIWCYTFSSSWNGGEQDDMSIVEQNGVHDNIFLNNINNDSVLSNNVMFGNNNYNNTFNYGCNINTFGPNCDTNVIGANFNNNIIGTTFKANDILNDFAVNKIMANFKINIILNTFQNNIILDDFRSNVILGGCSHNIIGSTSYYNKIERDFSYNEIGNGFCSNSIKYSCRNNEIGKDFKFNDIGINFQANDIDDYFQNNVIGSDFKNNTTSNNVEHNTIGNLCTHNNIFSGFKYNTVQNKFEYNDISGNNVESHVIGSDCHHITIPVSYVQRCEIKNGVSYITIRASNTSSSNVLQNHIILTANYNNSTISCATNALATVIVGLNSDNEVVKRHLTEEGT